MRCECDEKTHALCGAHYHWFQDVLQVCAAELKKHHSEKVLELTGEIQKLERKIIELVMGRE